MLCSARLLLAAQQEVPGCLWTRVCVNVRVMCFVMPRGLATLCLLQPNHNAAV